MSEHTGTSSGNAGKGEKLDTIFLLISIVGFMTVVALIFFGGFVALDFFWGRRGPDV